MTASPNHSDRGGARVRLVVIHTAEGARTAADLGNYFSRPSVQASSHVGIDNNRVEQYVDYSRYSWTLLNGNPISDNAELCGFARWSRDEWFANQGMLDRAAAWIRERCKARGIPIRKLTPAEVDAGHAGVIGHIDWSQSGVGQGDHWDPGYNFPWGYVIAKAAGGDPLPGGGGGGGPTVKPAVDFPLSAGHYFGDITGPDESHGGFHSDEQVWIRQVQQALQKAGKAPSYAGWADGIWEPPTSDSMRAWQASVGREQTGRCTREDWDALVRGRAGVTPPPATRPQPPSSGAPAWPLREDHWFGDINGPDQSHGGFYENERQWVRMIQQALIRKGYVPGITDPNHGWADGKFEQPTIKAVAQWQRDHMRGTTYFGQVWSDDWAKLLG